MDTKLKITRNEESKRYWVILMQGDKIVEHMRAFMFYDSPSTALHDAEIYADGVLAGFRSYSHLLPTSYWIVTDDEGMKQPARDEIDTWID